MSLKDSIKAVVNDAVSLASSSLQFVGMDGDSFRYRESLTGNEFTSPNIIEGAKGNPPEDALTNANTGKTTLQNISGGGSGLYGGKVARDAAKYVVDQETSGTGSKGKVTDPGKTIDAGTAVNSAMNRWNLFKTNNIKGYSTDGKASNAEAMSTVLYGKAVEPTAKNIVSYAKESTAASLGFDYDLIDFVQCEHYGQISNNHMVTLRRFPYPVADDIISPKIITKTGEVKDSHTPDLARAITWMSPALGNDLKSILNFKTAYAWKEIESEIQTIATQSRDRGMVGSAIDGNPLLSALEAGANGVGSVDAAQRRARGAGYDATKETYPNKVFGPYNVIKKILTREQGLSFEHNFTLVFHYDLKGYGKTSPKAAFMDTLSNILALTYNNAPFWGGATRYTGGSGQVGKPFGDMEKLRSGDYSGFLKGISDQVMGGASAIGGGLSKAWDGLMNGEGINALGNSKVLDNIIGGGLMKLFGGPSGGQAAAAFISGDPTGNWHLTVGNPMAPMMVIGNLCLQDTQYEFEGPLGYEDFPSKLKVTITLKPGRARDRGEIESMFNAGRGRMYLQPDDGLPTSPREGIVDAYGKKVPDGMTTRISDIGAG